MAVVVAGVSLAVAWLWKRAFLWGERVGPYGLFVAMDWTVLPLTLGSLAGCFTAAAVWLVRRARRDSSARAAALPSGLLWLASLAFLGACVPTLRSPVTPLDRLTARGRVYYLAGMTARMDTNDALFACDGVGWRCRQVYRSGDYAPAEPMRAALAYDEATNTWSIAVGGHGTIHRYRP